MPIFILIVGGVLVITGLNNTLAGPATPNLAGLLKNDLIPSNGQTSFFVWALAIVFIGMVGYFRPLRTISNLFLGLLFLAIFLAQSGSQGAGFFQNLTNAFKSIPSTASTSSGSSSSSSGNSGNGVASVIGGVVQQGAQKLLNVGNSEINSIEGSAGSLLGTAIGV